jgi:Lrp/AsnC family leucine-responsive transcriptional regulator
MIDELDQKIIRILSQDARISLKELAADVNLSAPSTSARVKRLEEKGVITGFSVDVDPAALGYALQAIVRFRTLPGKLHVVEKLIDEIPEVSECDKITGDDCFIARIHLRSIEQLDDILERISDKAETNTAIVRSQPVKRRLMPLG